MKKVIILLEVEVVDKQDFRLKTEQMFKYMKEKSYKEALQIAESMEWKKVKNVAVLNAVSEVFEANGEYQKSRDILFLAYDRAPESKKIIYRLGTLALKMGELKEAMDCYEEFMALAPKDPNGFIFKYKILKAKQAPLEEQIAVLEDFKKVEYIEKWAFELAQLYREAGMITECLEECDDLIIWFSEGKYIYKAMELKMQYKPLTPLQHEKYMNRPGMKPVEEVEAEVVEEAPTVEEEPVQEEPAEEEPTEDKPSLSIEELVQNFQEEQKENAQMIQAELERVEQEKAEAEPEDAPEEKEEILSDDVRRLMEELEAESAEIEAQKTNPEVEPTVVAGDTEETEAIEEENKPLLQKVVEQLAALDVNIQMPVKEAVASEEDIAVEQEHLGQSVEEIEELEEDEGIKLGDTQSMALAAKALANAATVEIPQIDIPEEPVVPATPITPVVPPTPVRTGTPYNTGFVVQGRYDLEAQSEIGLRAGLTEEQKKLFSYFVPVHGMSEQIVKVLQDDKECKSRYGTSRIGNVLIVGRKGSGKTVLAVDLVKAIQKSRRMKQGKVAIVKSESLNKKDVNEIIEKLHGGALVIEKASRLKRKTIEDLCEVMEGQTGELLVVLEDERKPIDRMLNEYPNFKKKFTSRIELPVFINDELVTFAQTYAKENGYKIDEMGILALYSEIDILQRDEKVVTVSDVKNIIDDAIENANKPSLKKLFKKVTGKNKDESDRVILKEEDFR
jgi:tetratricopeptide (TPR) repeat protein